MICKGEIVPWEMLYKDKRIKRKIDDLVLDEEHSAEKEVLVKRVRIMEALHDEKDV